MQWSMEVNAGFSTANPQKLHLPVISDPEEAIKSGAALIHPEPHGADGSHMHLKQGKS